MRTRHGRTTLLITGMLAFSLYLLPWEIALWRGHPEAKTILAVTLVLGWTVVGWLVMLVWSLRLSDSAPER